jgi:hypothetical protein
MKLSRLEWSLLALLVLVGAGAALVLRAADRATFELFFGWPAGGVWSNIVASVLWGAPAVYAILRKITKNHAEHLRLLRSHHEEHLAVLHEHHARLIEEIHRSRK